MKCLTVGQPWTDLIVKGIKDLEDHSWAPRHRGPLLIQEEDQPLAQTRPVRLVLREPASPPHADPLQRPIRHLHRPRQTPTQVLTTDTDTRAVRKPL